MKPHKTSGSLVVVVVVCSGAPTNDVVVAATKKIRAREMPSGNGLPCSRLGPE